MTTIISNSICPVCGDALAEEAVEVAVHSSLGDRDERFRVCSADCEDEVDSDPGLYLEAAKRDARAEPPLDAT